MSERSRTGLRWIALLSILLGSAVGLLMVWIALQHNPQGEFYHPDTGVLNWGNVPVLFTSWFLVVAVSLAVLGGVLASALQLLRSKNTHQATLDLGDE